MKTLIKNISSFLFMSAMVIGFQTAYASGHETERKGNSEARELLGTYLQSQATPAANTTYSFYNADAELVAEFCVKDNEESPELNQMLQKSELLMDEGSAKLYMVD
jgi:hypothetical protein